MRRRDFITALLLTPIVGRADAQQPPAMKRMALVSPANRVGDMKIGGDSAYSVSLQELQRLGFIEGENLIIDRYSAEGKRERYADLAREVVNSKPDLIAVAGTPLTLALMAATTSIPIVAITGDPIRQGIVSNIAHPGGNVTGVSVDAGFEIWGKRLQLLAEAIPILRTVLYVTTEATPWEGPAGKIVWETAGKLGITLVPTRVGPPVNEQTLRRTFETITRDQADGIAFSYAAEFFAYKLLIVELVRQVGIPAVYGIREQAEAGGLIAYSDDINQALRLGAQQEAEVLRGRKPAEMPYLQATKYELVINLKTAKALGLEIPPTLVARADAVIE
jgi:putative ABC transport system substrate-binding protein